jgi:hypothetical protein
MRRNRQAKDCRGCGWPPRRLSGGKGERPRPVGALRWSQVRILLGAPTDACSRAPPNLCRSDLGRTHRGGKSWIRGTDARTLGTKRGGGWVAKPFPTRSTSEVPEDPLRNAPAVGGPGRRGCSPRRSGRSRNSISPSPPDSFHPRDGSLRAATPGSGSLRLRAVANLAGVRPDYGTNSTTSARTEIRARVKRSRFRASESKRTLTSARRLPSTGPCLRLKSAHSASSASW